MASSTNLSRWYVVIFFIFVILILIISAYNLYETYRIKSQVPKEYHESQDILFVLNIIAIVIALLLLIGYYFAGDRSSGTNIRKGAINIQDQDQGALPSVLAVRSIENAPQPIKVNPFCRNGIVDVNKL